MAFLKSGEPFLCISNGVLFEKEDEGLLRLQNFHCKSDLYEEIMQQMQLFKNQISVFHIATALCTFRTQVVLQHII
jgi:hypothetical protein